MTCCWVKSPSLHQTRRWSRNYIGWGDIFPHHKLLQYCWSILWRQSSFSDSPPPPKKKNGTQKWSFGRCSFPISNGWKSQVPAQPFNDSGGVAWFPRLISWLPGGLGAPRLPGIDLLLMKDCPSKELHFVKESLWNPKPSGFSMMAHHMHAICYLIF